MNTTIVIPTYWGRPSCQPICREDGIYDHPTPLDTEGTLGRCIESIGEKLEPGSFDILVVAASTASSIRDDVMKQVRGIVEPYRAAAAIRVFGYRELSLIKARALNLGLNPDLIGLDGYGNIRNCQLLVPEIIGSDLVVAVDDDEVVDDPLFLDKATSQLGARVDGAGIHGISGFYRSVDGDCLIHEPEGSRETSNIYERKSYIQNQAYLRLMAAEGEIVPTNVAYGGCMSFSRELCRNIPHDPLISRGEDIDYLINSSLYGFNWFFNKDLSIIHMPPETNAKGAHSSLSYSKLHQDVYRFFYEREKIEAAAEIGLNYLSPEKLGIYPGTFLYPDTEEEALDVLRKKRKDFPDSEQFPAAGEIVRDAVDFARRNRNSFFRFVEEWRKLIAELSADEELRNELLHLMA